MAIQAARADYLELMGKHYLIDLCMALYGQHLEREAFERYNNEILRAIANNVAGAFGGTRFPKSWKELKDYKPETRSAEEIKTNILDGLHKLGGN